MIRVRGVKGVWQGALFSLGTTRDHHETTQLNLKSDMTIIQEISIKMLKTIFVCTENAMLCLTISLSLRYNIDSTGLDEKL